MEEGIEKKLEALFLKQEESVNGLSNLMEVINVWSIPIHTLLQKVIHPNECRGEYLWYVPSDGDNIDLNTKKIESILPLSTSESSNSEMSKNIVRPYSIDDEENIMNHFLGPW